MKNRKFYWDKTDPAMWGLSENERGELFIGNCSTLDLARRYGTPLHVVNSRRLLETASAFKATVNSYYPYQADVHYAFKCNPVPGVLSIIKNAGLKAEVMSDFELYMAVETGFSGNEIVVNGPFKTSAFLHNCLLQKVKLIVVDSLQELELLQKISKEMGVCTDILLRINPDYIPKGMNQGSSTGSRSGSPLGLDLVGGEADAALLKLAAFSNLHFKGLHFHIGSGIHEPDDYRKALLRLKPFIWNIKKANLKVSIMDTGGGFGTPHSREMTSFEMLKYQATGNLPRWNQQVNIPSPMDFIQAITMGLESLFPPHDMPYLILEPGRAITSSNQILLLTVHQVKQRSNGKKWLITDGGIGTVAMPVFYEFHELLLCNDVHREKTEKVTVSGPGCFAADIVYRNIHMPEVEAGEVISVMDSGAYFTSWESSFGYPLPAVAEAADGCHRIMRRRESYAEKLMRDEMLEHPVNSIQSFSMVSH
jgi:diaminopimelate decarboxylase